MNATDEKSSKRLYAFDAGILIDDNSEPIYLCARFKDFGITCEGAMVVIDRPEEWTDNTFGSWAEVDLQSLNEEGIGWLLSLVEHLIDLPHGSLGSDSLTPALRAYTSGMTAAITHYRPEHRDVGNGFN